MVKEIVTLEDLEKAFRQVPFGLDDWVDAFWKLYSHGYKLRFFDKDEK